MEKASIDFLDDEFEEEEDTLEDMYLIFKCLNKDYGIEIRYVTEIVALQSITEVPDLPPYIKGIINLRGRVFPVMDIRLRFNLTPVEYNERTCFVIATYDNYTVGLIVDAVSEVIKIPVSEVEPPPHTGDDRHNRYVDGIGKVGDSVKILLSLHNLVYNDDMKKVDSLISEVTEEEQTSL